jgi:spermidine synthase
VPDRRAHVPFVIEQNNATGAVSYWRGGGHQSEADENGVSLAEYIHLLYGLLHQAKAAHVLMIGGGGGTLATMLDRAGVKTVIVDVDPSAFEIARDYFHLPEHIERHAADGAQFLKKEKRRFDAIVLDAFSGAEIPAHLVTSGFFALVKSRLAARGGLCLVNLIVPDDDDPLPHEIGSRMGTVWRNVRLLDRPDWTERNAVLMAGRVKGLKRPHLLMKPRRRAKAIAAALKTFRFRPVLDRSL